MKTNKMETHVKENVNSFMKRILGTVELRRLSAKLGNGNSQTDVAYSSGCVEKSVLQVETAKNEAIVLVRRFQNY